MRLHETTKENTKALEGNLKSESMESIGRRSRPWWHRCSDQEIGFRTRQFGSPAKSRYVSNLHLCPLSIIAASKTRRKCKGYSCLPRSRHCTHLPKALGGKCFTHPSSIHSSAVYGLNRGFVDLIVCGGGLLCFWRNEKVPSRRQSDISRSAYFVRHLFARMSSKSSSRMFNKKHKNHSKFISSS